MSPPQWRYFRTGTGDRGSHPLTEYSDFAERLRRNTSPYQVGRQDGGLSASALSVDRPMAPFAPAIVRRDRVRARRALRRGGGVWISWGPRRLTCGADTG